MAALNLDEIAQLTPDQRIARLKEYCGRGRSFWSNRWFQLRALLGMDDGTIMRESSTDNLGPIPDPEQ